MSNQYLLVLAALICLSQDTQGFVVGPLRTPSNVFRKQSAGVCVFADVSDDVTESAADASEDAPVAEESGEAEAPKEEAERHTVFVGNMPFDTNNDALLELFSQHGDVKLVSIPKNDDTGLSKGFGFVDMASQEECQAAIDNLNGSEFNGRTLRVNPSLPKDKAKKQARKTDDGTQKLYVGNLPFESSQEDISELFSKYGKVTDCYLPMNPETGAPRGFAFVTVDKEVAQQAIEELNGIEYNERTLVVSEPLPQGAKKARNQRQKLYIGNLSFYTVPETLGDLFSEFGEVYDCYMPEDPERGGSRGFGFVTMDKEAAEAAIDATDGCELDGRIIRVNAAQPKGN
ncbi:29 kDa ribonucleoprotein A, chloroplastic [Seminavis robusta]|uniref:29 kDa ribonucleoprotein A, chloroplastic n=1 Tax=Seminavis robusta TaxID=568900 RepID=A0A9N8EPB0_9STRA|nr:29 kDa ribonucleoprotein A, chloroplastic [Seminavis robusta]|eukprot:Sro1330_g263450.1 29 kDa ribonucleoprotein A, chloroplastic (344) ;mRNA; f:24505-25909